MRSSHRCAPRGTHQCLSNQPARERSAEQTAPPLALGSQVVVCVETLQILERLRSSEVMKLTVLQSEHDELARRLGSIHDLVGAADSFVRTGDASVDSLAHFRALHDGCLRLASKVLPHPYSDAKVANRLRVGFRWEIAHAAVTRHPPIPLDTVVPRTGGYTYAVGVWDLSIYIKDHS